MRVAHASSCSFAVQVTGSPSAPMVRYTVYSVDGVTTRGTKRTYVGYTRSLSVRKFYHQLKTKPAFMRCMKPEDVRKSCKKCKTEL